jgi:hypothetical protein
LLLLQELSLNMLPLLDLHTMLLLRGCQGRRLQHRGNQPLIGWSCRRLLGSQNILLLLTLLQSQFVRGLTTAVHGTNGRQAHNPPQPLVQDRPRSTPGTLQRLWAPHAQNMLRL